MIRVAILCLIIAGAAALLGFGGVAGAFAAIAKVLFIIALALFAIFLLLGVLAGRRISRAVD